MPKVCFFGGGGGYRGRHNVLGKFFDVSVDLPSFSRIIILEYEPHLPVLKIYV